jgi:hypothetical protein
MNSVWIVAIVFAVLLAAILFQFFRRVIHSGPTPPPDHEWASAFRATRYQPMTRLLRSSDFEYLAAQPGYTPEMTARLRAQRRRIFRSYLGNLQKDFDRLSSVAKSIAVNATEDRSELVAGLLHQRMRFMWALSLVEVRLALHWAGDSALDVRGLVEAVELMRVQIQDLSASASLA